MFYILFTGGRVLHEFICTCTFEDTHLLMYINVRLLKNILDMKKCIHLLVNVNWKRFFGIFCLAQAIGPVGCFKFHLLDMFVDSSFGWKVMGLKKVHPRSFTTKAPEKMIVAGRSC